MNNLVKKYKKLIAFTLAEILITLTVIGVVAAITLPNLIVKIQKRIIASQLKTTYSLLSQSIERSACRVENPNWIKDLYNTPISNTNISELTEKCITGNLKRVKNYGVVYPADYGFPIYHNINNVQMAPTSTTGSIFLTMKLVNGAFLFLKFAEGSRGNVANMSIYIDVNGKRGPNVYGKDLYLFYVSEIGRLYIPGYNNSRQNILKNCSRTSTSYWDTFCSALIQKDNWEIKDDYPW